MDKINEQIYNANVELVDRNRILDADNKMMQRRMNKIIEYIEKIYSYKENVITHTFDKDNIRELYEIAKGEDYE